MKRPTPERIVDLVLWVIVFAGILGVVAGFWFYRYQLPSINPLLWVFVMDSPLAGLLVACSAYLALQGVTNEWTNVLSFMAGVSSLKVGLWAIAALWLFAPSFFSPELALTSGFLVITHLVQIAEGVLLLGVQKFRAWMLPAGLVWFLVNDWLDYGPLQLHPQLPPLATPALTAQTLGTVGVVAGVLSVVLVVGFAWAARGQARVFPWRAHSNRLAQ